MTLTRGARGAKINAIERAIQSAADGLGLSMSLRDARMHLAGSILSRSIKTYNDLSDKELISVEQSAKSDQLLSWIRSEYNYSQRLPGV